MFPVKTPTVLYFTPRLFIHVEFLFTFCFGIIRFTGSCEKITCENSKISVVNSNSDELYSNSTDITEYDDTLSKDSTYKNVLSYYIEKQGMKIDFSKNDGIYNKEEALSYFNKAKEELPSVFDDVIVIDILTVANNELLYNQANVIKSSIEDSLGVNNIRVDIITVRNQYEYYLAGSSGAKCYDLYFDMSVNADFYSDINVLEKIFYNLIKNS